MAHSYTTLTITGNEQQLLSMLRFLHEKSNLIPDKILEEKAEFEDKKKEYCVQYSIQPLKNGERCITLAGWLKIFPVECQRDDLPDVKVNDEEFFVSLARAAIGGTFTFTVGCQCAAGMLSCNVHVELKDSHIEVSTNSSCPLEYDEPGSVYSVVAPSAFQKMAEEYQLDKHLRELLLQNVEGYPVYCTILHSMAILGNTADDALDDFADLDEDAYEQLSDESKTIAEFITYIDTQYQVFEKIEHVVNEVNYDGKSADYNITF